MKGSTFGHWVDETLPERARELLTRSKINADEFQRNVGPLLGSYRSGEHFKSNMPQQSDEAEYVRRLSDLLAKAAQQMTRAAIPPRTHALLLSVLHLRMGEDWHALQARVLRDLALMQAALPIVGGKLRAQPATRGPKLKQGRAELLERVINEITRQLGPPKKTARILALEVLRACEIDVPNPDKKEPQRAAARAAKKGRHRN